MPGASSDRTRGIGGPRHLPLFGLAPDGVYLASRSPGCWWALTPPLHPYPTPVASLLNPVLPSRSAIHLLPWSEPQGGPGRVRLGSRGGLKLRLVPAGRISTGFPDAWRLQVCRAVSFCGTILGVSPTGRYPASCPGELGLSSGTLAGSPRSPVPLTRAFYRLGMRASRNHRLSASGLMPRAAALSAGAPSSSSAPRASNGRSSVARLDPSASATP